MLSSTTEGKQTKKHVTLEERNRNLWRVKDTIEVYRELHEYMYPTLSSYVPVCGMQSGIIETLLFSYVPEDKRAEAIQFMEDVIYASFLCLVKDKIKKHK